jgi:undecaprenyl-diphosphatase
MDFIQTIDEAISGLMLNLHGSSFINYLLKFITLLGEVGVVWIITLLGLIIYKGVRYKKLSILLISAGVFLLIGWMFNDLFLKVTVQRIRPYHNEEAFGDAFKLFMESINYKFPSSYSFPSGHAFSSFNVATGLTLYNKKYGYIAYPLAILIGFSRIFVGAHYFTDIIIGAILGIIFGTTGHFIGKKVLSKLEVKGVTYASR